MKKHILGLIVGAAALVGCGGAVELEHAQPDASELVLVSTETARAGNYPVLASNQPAPGEVVAAEACWVTLHWCAHPELGGPVCSGSGCAFERFQSACLSLIRETC